MTLAARDAVIELGCPEYPPEDKHIITYPLNQGAVQDDFSMSRYVSSLEGRHHFLLVVFHQLRVKQLESSKYEAAVASSRLNKA